jgi:hypothetical protein
MGNEQTKHVEVISYENATEQEKMDVDNYIEKILQQKLNTRRFGFNYECYVHPRNDYLYDIFKTPSRDIYFKIDMVIEKIKKLTDLSFIIKPFMENNFFDGGYIGIQFLQENKKERIDIYFDDASQKEQDIIKKLILDTNLKDLEIRTTVFNKEDDRRHFLVYYENNKSIYLQFEKFIQLLSLNPDYEFSFGFSNYDNYNYKNIHQNGLHYVSPGIYTIKIKKIA